jgi:hypothetical protein
VGASASSSAASHSDHLHITRSSVLLFEHAEPSMIAASLALPFEQPLLASAASGQLGKEPSPVEQGHPRQGSRAQPPHPEKTPLITILCTEKTGLALSSRGRSNEVYHLRLSASAPPPRPPPPSCPMNHSRTCMGGVSTRFRAIPLRFYPLPCLHRAMYMIFERLGLLAAHLPFLPSPQRPPQPCAATRTGNASEQFNAPPFCKPASPISLVTPSPPSPPPPTQESGRAQQCGG